MPLPINFRRDLAGKVYGLTQYNALQPQVDKNYDTKKLNERFIKLNHAVRTCFDAIADLASRDPSFLPSFFAGFVNPVYVKTFKYDVLENHTFIDGFNSNGTPMSFPDARTVYSYPDLGDVTHEEYECLLFLDGELMPLENYTLSNTAYGVKAYVKTETLKPGQEVTLSVHRVYNRDYRMWKHTAPANTTIFDHIVEVDTHFPNFYSVEYIQVAVRRMGEPRYRVLDPKQCSITVDSANRKMRVKVDNLNLSKFDTVIVYDTTSYFRQSLTGSNDTAEVAPLPPVVLSQAIPVTGETVPVGFSHHRDFDIWLNGRHLTPGKHFVVTPGYSVGMDYENLIEFLIEQPAYSNYRIEVIKNVPYKKDNTTYVTRENLDPKGVEIIANAKFPIIRNMGEAYVNGRLIDPAKLSTVHRDILVVDGLNEGNEFFYKFNPPINDATNGMITETALASTDFDKMVNLIGGTGELVARTKQQREYLPVAERNDLVDDYVGVTLPILSSHVRFLMAAIPDISLFQMDANAPLADRLWDMAFWDPQLLNDVIVDSNRVFGGANDILIDANYADYRLANAKAGVLEAMSPIITNFVNYANAVVVDLTRFDSNSNIPLIDELWNLVAWNGPVIEDVQLDGNVKLVDNVTFSGN